MKIGVFCPIGNNGWLLSENAPQYKPTFELNKQIVQRAEHYGFDFALSMIKLRGFGGKTEFWDYNLETFTLMAGLAAVTSKIKIFATAATLVMPPAIVARMASTIDSISNGRFGLNVVTGWQPPEYTQMGLWPGNDYFSKRYDYLSEYVEILRELWATGTSDFKGEFFQMEDCQVKPKPQADMKIICAGQSDAGLAFSAKYADYNFVFGKGLNTPTAYAEINDRLKVHTDQTGRDVQTYVLFMVIAAETDQHAMAKWESYNQGADLEAINWLMNQGGKDQTSGTDTNIRQMASSVSPVNINMGTIVGSYENVAKMLDEISTIQGTEGILLTFDDFIQGVEDFGQRIQPLMTCREEVVASYQKTSSTRFGEKRMTMMNDAKAVEHLVCTDFTAHAGTGRVLKAEPESIQLAPEQTALIVIDMQNAYTSIGGYLDLAGFDVSATQPVVANIKKSIDAAHTAGIQVIYFQNGWDEQYVEAGGLGSPNFHKSNALKTMRKNPDLQGKLLAKGGWDFALIDELRPQAQDIVIEKPRYSGFFNTALDSILRARGIRNLVFVGIATNVCVESTLRDGFFLEYFGVALKDACYQAGPPAAQEAALYNIQTFFGWVSDTASFIKTFNTQQAQPNHLTFSRTA